MRWFSLLILGLIFFCPVSAFSGEVRVAVSANHPLSFTNDEGLSDGLMADLFKKVAKKEGWTIKFVSCSWKECLKQLEDGDLDVIPAIAYTEQRAKKFQFANETVLSSWGQIYQRKNHQIDSILSLSGKRLAVVKKDVYYLGNQGLLQVADKFGLDIQYVEVDSYLGAFTKLLRGEVDAAMVGRIYGLKNRQKFGFFPAPIMIKPVQVRPAFSQSAPAKLVTQFDQILATWKTSTDSFYYQALEKWLGEKQVSRLPDWLRLLMYSLASVLVFLLIITLWTGKQVRLKTLELADKNRLLEKELAERHRIEKELGKKEEQYRVFFEDSETMIIFVDPTTARIVDVNPAACRYYQYTREQLQTMHGWEINQAGKDEIWKKISLVKGGEKHQFEFTHRLANGELRPVEVHSSPIQMEGQTLICSIIHDISKRKKAERALEERTQFLQSVIDGVSDPLMVIGLDYNVLQINQAAKTIQEYSRESNDTLSCHLLSHGSHAPCNELDHPCPLQEVKQTRQPVTMVHHHTSDLGQRIVELTASPLFDAEGEVYAIIEVSRDITDRIHIEELLNENEKRLHHLAHHDSLTNLPNRLLFEDRLTQALSKARRSRRQVALFFLDLDHLKEVNDNLGHNYGDMLLIDIAKRLRKCVREGDTVARMGGDEFLVLLEEIESIEIIEATAERICRSLSHELVKGDFTQKISASIGISIFPEDASSGQELLRNADLAMYRVKAAGKANYQFYAAPQGRFIFD